MRKSLFPLLGIGLAASFMVSGFPATAQADTTSSVAQGVGSGVLNNASYFGNVPDNTPVTVDVVMKVQNQTQLANFIDGTVNSSSSNFRKYLSPDQFSNLYGGNKSTISAVQLYFKLFGIQTTVAKDNLVITANGTAGQFNKAFNISLQWATYQGKKFHGTKQAPQLPSTLANSILCILGLSDYSNLESNAIKRDVAPGDNTPTGPLSLG